MALEAKKSPTAISSEEEFSSPTAISSKEEFEKSPIALSSGMEVSGGMDSVAEKKKELKKVM
jgi:hypothetical protein